MSMNFWFWCGFALYSAALFAIAIRVGYDSGYFERGVDNMEAMEDIRRDHKASIEKAVARAKSDSEEAHEEAEADAWATGFNEGYAQGVKDLKEASSDMADLILADVEGDGSPDEIDEQAEAA